MNAFSLKKCATHVCLAAAAIAGIVFAAGCGNGSGITPPNNQGFTNGSFSGTYVISITGTDVNSTNEVVPFTIVGTIQPNGNAGFGGGSIDIIDPGNLGINLGEAISTTSSYAVSTDGRGTGSLVTSVGTFNIDFVLSSTSGGLISRFDDGSEGIGTGSGMILQQTPTSQSALTALAFGLSGADGNGFPLATVGGFTLSGSGSINTGGMQDINDNNSSAQSNNTTGIAITGGSVVLNSAGTGGTATITNASADFTTLSFNVWVVSSTQLIFDETDGSNVLSGNAFTQQTTFPTGQIVFTLSGQNGTPDLFVAGGYATADSSGDGNLTEGLEDYNDSLNNSTVPTFTASTTNNGTGRFQLATTAFANGTDSNLQFAAYPSSGGVLMLENDSEGLAVGAAYAQSATALATSGGYAFNLTGANNLGPATPFGEVDDIAQFNPGAPATSSSSAPNMTGSLDENVLGSLQPTSTLSGVYVPDTTNDGRGSITATNTNTLLGGFDLQYYVVNSSTVLFIDVDSESLLDTDTFQVGTGVFQTQSSSASANLAHSAAFVAHPFLLRHAAFERGKTKTN
jgi:hypothetical protein